MARVAAAAASLLMVIVLAQPARATVPGASAAADPGSADPVLNDAARPAWGYIEDQATSILAAHGLVDSEQDNRPLIRSYLFVHLIAIIEKASRDGWDSLSKSEQRALAFLEDRVSAERHMAALDAYAKYSTFATEQQGCSPASGPVYSDGSDGMGGIACVLSQAFGNQPSAPAFNAAGFAEATQAFQDPTVGAAFFDTSYSLSFWSRPAAVAGESAEQAALEEQLSEALHDTLAEAGKEALQELGTALFEVSTHETGASSWAAMSAALAIIVASGVWSGIDAHNTANDLESAASHTPTVDLGSLEKMTTASGAAELLFVVLAQTLPSGNAIPATATQKLPGGAVAGTSPSVYGDFPCSWDASAEFEIKGTVYSGCFGYTFAADPDSVSARYQGDPPAHSAGDPDFVLTRNVGGAMSLVAPASTSLQISDAGLVPWVAADSNGHPFFYDKSSARNLEYYSDIRTPACDRQPCPPSSYDGYHDGLGYSSYLHDGRFVTEAT